MYHLIMPSVILLWIDPSTPCTLTKCICPIASFANYFFSFSDVGWFDSVKVIFDILIVAASLPLFYGLAKVSMKKYFLMLNDSAKARVTNEMAKMILNDFVAHIVQARK